MKADDKDIYLRSIELLSDYKLHAGGRRYKGRFVQIFLALKFYQSQIPSIHSGTYISSEVLQSLLDDLYAKYSRPLNACILSIFEANHLARTGVIPVGGTTSSNIWRNNLHLQKGIGCYASPEELASRTFLNEPRENCRHLVGNLENGRCELQSDARYRGESHRKWLRIDPGGNGFAVVDLMNISNFLPYVAPDGERIPIIPLVYALYYDGNPGLAVGSRPDVTIQDFCFDFNFSEGEFAAYFDQDINNKFNASILAEFPSIGFTPVELTDGVPAPREATQPRGKLGSRTAAAPLPTPVLTGTVTPPPQTHSGWEAEQFVFDALGEAGWEVYDVRRQKVGYDLLAKKGRKTLYIEVKSSVGYCFPSFTSREWQQAITHKSNYVVAIIENFNPSSDNTVYWVENPSITCSQTELRTISHCIPRSSWIVATKRLVELGS